MSNVCIVYAIQNTIHPFVRSEEENRSQNIHSTSGSGGGGKDTYSLRTFVCIKRAKLRVIYTRCAHAFIYICMVDCDCDCIGILFDLFDVRRYVRIRWALHKINVRHATHLTFINRIECVRERMNGVSAARTNLRTQAN